MKPAPSSRPHSACRSTCVQDAVGVASSASESNRGSRSADGAKKCHQSSVEAAAEAKAGDGHGQNSDVEVGVGVGHHVLLRSALCRVHLLDSGL